MPVNDFLPYATGPTANVISQATWSAGNLSQGQTRAVGFVGSTIAESQEVNKIWRQSQFIAAGIAQFLMEQLGVDVLDDGDLEGFVAKLRAGFVSLQPRVQLPPGVQQNYYVSNAGSDVTGDGLTQGTAWQTLQYAANFLIDRVDFNGQTVQVNLAPGNYAPFTQNGNPIGCFGPSNLIYNGNVANPASVIISSPSAAVPATYFINGQATIQGVTLTTSGDAFSQCIWGAFGSFIFLQNVVFGNCSASHIVATTGSIVRPTGPYTITGGAYSHLYGEQGGIISSLGEVLPGFPAFHVTVTGSPTFVHAFATANHNSTIDLNLTVLAGFIGSAIGPRYEASSCSVITVAPSGGANFFPGSIAGTADAASFGVYQG